MTKQLLFATLLSTLLIPTAICAEHHLAGVEIRNLKLDSANAKMSFDIVNTTDKWITAWAWRIETSNSPDGAGVRWYDNYPAIDIPGFASTPPDTATRIRPGEVRQMTDPLLDSATDVSLVAIVFEDTAAYGESSVLDRLEKRRQMDVEVYTALLADTAQIRVSLNAADTLRQLIERISPPPQNKSEKDLLVRTRLEEIQRQLKLGQSPAPLIAVHEKLAQARLERAKAQAHFRRMQ